MSFTLPIYHQQYIIREVQESDTLKIRQMVMAMSDETDNFPFSSQDYGMSPEAQRSFIAYMNQMPNCIYLGAFLEGKPCGVIYLDGGKRIRTQHVCTLGMGIAKDHWNKGLGKTMLKAVLEFAADSQYIAKIDLQVLVNNLPAIHIYKSAGFEVEGRNKRALFMDGEFYDYLLMGKLID